MTNYQLETRQWWVERWLELLDSYRFKKRLERARNYAREGNVLRLEFIDSELNALVQGSEVEPYHVSLRLDPFNDEDWNFIIETLSEKAIYSAQLLSGQMPASIEQVFIKNGLNLFPYTLGDIHSHCSCPDQANPCKHIGAVYYQLADRFSEDPFIIFQLRGRSRDQILAALRSQRGAPIPSSLPIAVVEQSPKTVETQDIQAETANFWVYDYPLDSDLCEIVPPSGTKSILELLGPIPLPYESAQEVKQSLIQLYSQVSQEALTQALGTD